MFTFSRVFDSICYRFFHGWNVLIGNFSAKCHRVVSCMRGFWCCHSCCGGGRGWMGGFSGAWWCLCSGWYAVCCPRGIHQGCGGLKWRAWTYARCDSCRRKIYERAINYVKRSQVHFHAFTFSSTIWCIDASSIKKALITSTTSKQRVSRSSCFSVLCGSRTGALACGTNGFWCNIWSGGRNHRWTCRRS